MSSGRRSARIGFSSYTRPDTRDFRVSILNHKTVSTFANRISPLINKLVLSNLSHRPVRSVLSVLAIAVEVTMILTLVGVSYGTLDGTARRARGVGADIMIRPARFFDPES